ncbi:MAG: class II fructose-bisphosphate aldolase [Acidimicrobiales bacterium]
MATVPQLVARTERARALMARSSAEGFAVGAFNVDNLETLLAVARAAQATAAPAFVEASGTPDETYAAAARGGISKINVNSELRYPSRTALERGFVAHPDEFATVKLVGPVIDAVQAVVEAKITAFGSAGHSRL